MLSGIRLSSDIIYDDQYIKTKVKTFKMVKTLFDNDKTPEEKIEHKCIPCISVDSTTKSKKENKFMNGSWKIYFLFLIYALSKKGIKF